MKIKTPKKTEKFAYTVDVHNNVVKHVGVFIGTEFFERHGRGYRPLDIQPIYKTHAEAAKKLKRAKRLVMYQWLKWSEDGALVTPVTITIRDVGYDERKEYLGHNADGTLRFRRAHLGADLFKTFAGAKRAALKHLRAELKSKVAQAHALRAKIRRLEARKK